MSATPLTAPVILMPGLRGVYVSTPAAAASPASRPTVEQLDALAAARAGVRAAAVDLDAWKARAAALSARGDW